MEQAITIGNTVGAGIEDLLKNDANGMKIKRSFYQNQKVQEILCKMIPYYDEIGTFDRANVIASMNLFVIFHLNKFISFPIFMDEQIFVYFNSKNNLGTNR